MPECAAAIRRRHLDASAEGRRAVVNDVAGRMVMAEAMGHQSQRAIASEIGVARTRRSFKDAWRRAGGSEANRSSEPSGGR